LIQTWTNSSTEYKSFIVLLKMRLLNWQWIWTVISNEFHYSFYVKWLPIFYRKYICLKHVFHSSSRNILRCIIIHTHQFESLQNIQSLMTCKGQIFVIYFSIGQSARLELVVFFFLITPLSIGKLYNYTSTKFSFILLCIQYNVMNFYFSFSFFFNGHKRTTAEASWPRI
jgi:hypothetical protein